MAAGSSTSCTVEIEDGGSADEERASARGEMDTGLRVRLNQEHVGRRVGSPRLQVEAEAAYWEAWYAAQYGLPTALFHGLGRSLSMGRLLLELYSNWTRTRAKALMHDLDLHPEFPHHRPRPGAAGSRSI